MPDTPTLTSQRGRAAAQTPPVMAVVEITVKPQDEARVLGELVAATRRWAGEAGCSHAAAWRDLVDETRFLVLEGFVSEDAFQAHLARPSTGEFASRVQQYLAAPPVRTIWRPAAE